MNYAAIVHALLNVFSLAWSWT